MNESATSDESLIEAERTAFQTWKDAEAYEEAMGKRYLESVRCGEEFRKAGKERRADYLTAVQQSRAWSWVWYCAISKRDGKDAVGHAIAAEARPVPKIPS